MNILISNDDGIAAIGIKKLAQFLGLVEGCRVYVCAPDSERSNIGHGITIRSDLYLTEVPADGFGPAAVWAASCSGTPADCVRLALSVLKEKGVQIDMVCGGINNGLNCGTDINYSGTIAVCREAVIDGVPEAIAFSSSTGMAYVDNFSFIIPDIIKKYAGNIPKDHLLNVNVLDRPWSDVKGYAAASLAVNT